MSRVKPQNGQTCPSPLPSSGVDEADADDDDEPCAGVLASGARCMFG
jgi:hypothetical protein